MKTISLTSFLLAPGALTGATMIQWDPLPYFSEADSPFYHGIQNGTIYLEDFEDQELNTPFVIVPETLPFFGTTRRALNPDALIGTVWSVDGDDGNLDGNGFSGDSWIGINKSGFTGSSRMQFEFLPDDQGQFPTYVGIVVTGANNIDLDVDVTALDLMGISLSSDGEYDPKEWRPPGGAIGGDPRTHRFIGFYNEDGISDLLLANVFQVDHLQYGYAIPEPSSVALLAMGLGLLTRRCRC